MFNLDIFGFVNPDDPAEGDYRVRDIHGDKDSLIIERINKRNEWLEVQRRVMTALEKPELKEMQGMSANERLHISGLMDDFDKYKKTNKKFAQFILERLKVDRSSIEKKLK